MKTKIASIEGYQVLNKGPTYNEFLIKCPDIDLLIRNCKKRDLLPPLKMSRYFPEMKDIALVCVTEANSLKSIENFLQAAKAATNKGGNKDEWIKDRINLR